MMNRELLIDRALKHDDKACVELGNRYYIGDHEFDMNINNAIFWWRQAAELNNVEAQYSLGIFYYNKCEDQSRYWWDKASNNLKKERRTINESRSN